VSKKIVILEYMESLSVSYLIIEDNNNSYIKEYDCLDMELGHVPGYSEEHESVLIPNKEV
jgi:hypothetical protein